MSEQNGSGLSWPRIKVLPSAIDVGVEDASPYLQGLVSLLEKHQALSQVSPTRIELSKSEKKDSAKSDLIFLIYVTTLPSDAEMAITHEVVDSWVGILPRQGRALLIENKEWDFTYDYALS